MKSARTKKYLIWGSSIVVVGLLAGMAFSMMSPISYESSLSFTVNQINKQNTQDYQFDGFYALQASDLFSDTIVSWFQTPSFLLEVYDRAGVDPKITSINGFTSRFNIKKFSAQNLVLEFSTLEKVEAEKISQAIISHVEERSGQLNQNADNKAIFEVVGSAPVIVKKETTLVAGMVYGVIAGLACNLFIFAISAAFFRTEKEELPTHNPIA